MTVAPLRANTTLVTVNYKSGPRGDARKPVHGSAREGEGEGGFSEGERERGGEREMSERERERGTTEGDRGGVKREGVGGEEGGGAEELRTLLHKD